jgi:hypothetical protein
MQVVTYLHGRFRGDFDRHFLNETCARPGRPFLGCSLPYIRAVRRNWFFRSLASVFAVWLATCMVEPMQLHTCAMHGGLVIEQTSSAHGHAASGHHMAMHRTGHSDQNQDTDSQSHQCSCLGDCNGGSAPVGLTASAAGLSEPAIVDNAVSSFDYTSTRLVAAAFLLPFSNGPPASSSRA